VIVEVPATVEPLAHQNRWITHLVGTKIGKYSVRLAASNCELAGIAF
jgi:hypothetical protein